MRRLMTPSSSSARLLHLRPLVASHTNVLARHPQPLLKQTASFGSNRRFLSYNAAENQKQGWVDPKAVPSGEFLKKYGQDLTEMAKERKLDPVISRDQEVLRVLRILSRRTKSNPVLIGEAGVGKSAIAGEIAERIYQGEVPESLKNKRVISLDLPSIVAGAKYKGEFEERLQGCLRDVTESNGEIILFIDEIHLLLGAGGGQDSMSAANIMKPALARGDLHCIGATTLDEYRQYFEKDAALTRRFGSVFVSEPNVEDTISILRGLKERYELHHGVRIDDNAIVAAATLADRYVSERKMPDKAIDLVDEAASRLRLQQESKPDPIWNLEREVIRRKIELEALKRETDEASKARREDLEEKIKEAETKLNELNKEWDAEKNEIKSLKEVQVELENLKQELDRNERQGNYERAGEIKHSLLPELEKRLKHIEQEDSNSTKGPRKPKLLEDHVMSEHVAQVVSDATGIPVKQLEQGERERLLKMEEELKKSVVGQDEAVSAISNLVRRSKAGLSGRHRPIASFLFAGPTGVGKTQLCKSLAKYLFDDESHMMRVDMSEYQERHSISRLIGAPPGYVGYESGGLLTEAVRRRPYQVILFDEFEKAHREVGNVLLQVFDDGRLTDSQGRVVDFKNTIIVLTSNLGSHAYDMSLPEQERKEEVMRAIRGHMTPELLNRIDEVCIFNQLGRQDMDAIVVKEMETVQEFLKQDRDVTLETSEKLRTWISDQGFDPRYGARPLRREIQVQVLNPLSVQLLDGTIKDGDHVVLDLDEQENRVSVEVVPSSSTEGEET